MNKNLSFREVLAYGGRFSLFYKYEYYRKYLTKQFSLLLKITSLSLLFWHGILIITQRSFCPTMFSEELPTYGKAFLLGKKKGMPAVSVYSSKYKKVKQLV